MKVSLTTFLTILFIILKLTEVIDWSWLWVLSPLWITFAAYAFILILFLVFAAFIPLKVKSHKKNY